MRPVVTGLLGSAYKGGVEGMTDKVECSHAVSSLAESLGICMRVGRKEPVMP